MPLSTIDKADRLSSRRAALMMVGAAVMLVLAGLDAASVPYDTARTIIWPIAVILWLGVLATGGGLFARHEIRGLVDDSVARANRHRAIESGFWAAMAMVLLLYFANFAWPLRNALGMLSGIALATALGRYAWLERG